MWRGNLLIPACIRGVLEHLVLSCRYGITCFVVSHPFIWVAPSTIEFWAMLIWRMPSLPDPVLELIDSFRHLHFVHLQ